MKFLFIHKSNFISPVTFEKWYDCWQQQFDTSEEIKTILDVRDRGKKPCSLVQSLIDNKIEQLEIQIKRMSLLKQELQEYRQSWMNNPNPESDSQEVCPLTVFIL